MKGKTHTNSKKAFEKRLAFEFRKRKDEMAKCLVPLIKHGMDKKLIKVGLFGPGLPDYLFEELWSAAKTLIDES